MAAWQLDLLIIPRKRAESLGFLRQLSSSSNCEEIDWWKGGSLPPGYEERLAGFLLPQTPWDKHWLIFGDENGTRVDVVHNNERIDEVRARIDVREIDLDLLEKLLAFVAESDCIFLNSAGAVIEPSIENIIIEIEASSAANFVHDPKRFLAWRRRSE
jgi:hypothetical protein